MCNTKAHAKPTKQAHNTSKPDYEFAAVYAMECCHDRDFCNDGEFPQLPPTLPLEDGKLVQKIYLLFEKCNKKLQ